MKDMLPPDMGNIEDAQKNYPFPMMLAHVNEQELAAFNVLQGGEIIDPVLKIPCLAGLVDKFLDEETRDKFVDIVTNLRKQPQQPLDQDLSGIKDKMQELAPPTPKTPDSDPFMQNLKDDGRKGDDEIVYIPVAICDFLDTVLGEPKVNADGLPEYFLPLLLPALGGILGGGMATTMGMGALGIGLGAAAGSAIGTGLSGNRKVKDMAKNALIGGLTQGIGAAASAPALGFTNPGIASLKAATHFGTSALVGKPLRESLLGAGAVGLGHGFFGPEGAEAAYGPGGALLTAKAPVASVYAKPFNAFGGYLAPSSVANMTQGQHLASMKAAHDAAIAAGVASAASTAASTGSGGITNAILGAGMLGNGQQPQVQPNYMAPEKKSPFSLENLLPVALSSGLLYKGHKDQMKHEQSAEAKYRAQIAQLGNIPEAAPRETRYVPNPHRQTPIGASIGIAHQPYLLEHQAHYASGGHVQQGRPGEMEFLQGPGKGRDDSINYDYVYPNDYIGNAASVSALGDGSSRAGAAELAHFLHSVPDDHSTNYHNQKPIPAALSDGEFRIPASKVAAIGGGDTTKGAKKLDAAFANLLKYKSGHGSKLPPKAKPFENYISGR